jgi:predicted enzyme related to lactoylglutathione lyase
MVGFKKPRAIGFNHVALEVGDIEEALAFYGCIFDFQLRGKSGTMASSILATKTHTARRRRPSCRPRCR